MLLFSTDIIQAYGIKMALTKPHGELDVKLNYSLLRQRQTYTDKIMIHISTKGGVTT